MFILADCFRKYSLIRQVDLCKTEDERVEYRDGVFMPLPIPIFPVYLLAYMLSECSHI